MESGGWQNPGAEGSQADPGVEAFTEESMWQVGGVGLGGGQESYPERPNEANCKYYLRTGFCGYGSRCRFNHPPDRSQVVGDMRLRGGEYPQRVGQPVCKYYMMTGTCKFGSSCKYHHPRHGGGTHVSLNYLSYPLRPGEKECSYYVKTGHCKFGVTCKFHHPQPANIPVTTSASPSQGIPPPAPGMYPFQGQPSSAPAPPPYGVVPGSWQVARPPTMIQGPYIQGTFPHMLLPPGVVPVPGWAHYPAQVSPAASPTNQQAMGPSFYGMTQLSSSAPEYTRSHSSASLSAGPSSSSQKDRPLPERPGQPECQYYMRTGECKYGSSCRYHHPPDLIGPKASSELKNLPIRPGAPPCIYFAQHGVCKYGSGCKYDHTMLASASSLTDMPVALYPEGSATGTLAASSSSSDFHQEIAAISRKDSSPIPVTSSVASSIDSPGSIPPKSQPAQHSTGTSSK